MVSPSRFENKDLQGSAERFTLRSGLCCLYAIFLNTLLTWCPLPLNWHVYLLKRGTLFHIITEQWSKLGSWTWIQCHPISSKARFQNVCLLQRQALPRNMALEWSRLFCPFWTRTVAQSFFIFTWSFSSFNLDILGRVQAICFVDGYLIWVCLMFPRD